MRFFWSMLSGMARAAGYELRVDSAKRPNPIRPWETDPAFVPVAAAIRGRTAMGVRKQYMLYQFVRDAARRHPGTPMAEVGAYRGGSAYLMAAAAESCPIEVFDTFGGMPETDPGRDWHQAGDFEVDPEEVLAFLSRRQNIRTHQGLFPGTAEGVRGTSFSFVHIDVDIHRSVRDCLEFFYPRMVPGGILLSDDYGAVTCAGAKDAWDAFFADKPESSVYLPTGQSFVIRAPDAAAA